MTILELLLLASNHLENDSILDINNIESNQNVTSLELVTQNQHTGEVSETLCYVEEFKDKSYELLFLSTPLVKEDSIRIPYTKERFSMYFPESLLTATKLLHT